MIVDPERGKALVDIKVARGAALPDRDFEVTGSRHFSSEDLARFYPFGDQPTTLTAR